MIRAACEWTVEQNVKCWPPQRPGPGTGPISVASAMAPIAVKSYRTLGHPLDDSDAFNTLPAPSPIHTMLCQCVPVQVTLPSREGGEGGGR